MGKCVRIRGGKPSPSPTSPAEAAAYLTLRSGRRVPVAAGRRHHRRGSSAACRRCGVVKGACVGSVSPPGRRKSAEPRPPHRPPGGSQLSGGRLEEVEEERLPSEACPVSHDDGDGDGDGCGDGVDSSFGPNTPLAGDVVKAIAKHGHGSTAIAGAGQQLPLPSPSQLETEMEAFFAAAELAERRRFAEAYNYDVALDRPLEGRFEWTPLST